ADDERHAQAALIEVALAVAQGAVERRRRVGAFQRRQTAVVRGEDYDGVVGQFQVVELLQDAGDAVVEALEHGGIDGVRLLAGRRLVGVLLYDLRLRLQWDVWGVVRQVQEEGFVLVLLDELLRLDAETIREILALLRLLQAGHEAAHALEG